MKSSMRWREDFLGVRSIWTVPDARAGPGGLTEPWDIERAGERLKPQLQGLEMSEAMGSGLVSRPELEGSLSLSSIPRLDCGPLRRRPLLRSAEPSQET